MNSEFLKKNLTTILMIGATVVLGGVAVFTAVRLYQLRSEPVAPNAPESEPAAQDSGVEAKPKSGSWNYPEAFIVTNTSNQTRVVQWLLDCWDESVCQDTSGTETLEPGQSFEKGLGSICAKWQLDIEGDGFRWGGIAEKSDDCNKTSTPTSTPTSTGTPTSTPTSTPTTTPTSTPRAEFGACTVLSFTLTTSTPTGTPTSTPTSTPTTTPTTTPTSTATSTPTSTPTSTATSTPTSTVTSSNPTSTPQATLPPAGIGTPTIIGLGAGILLLLGALVLAL